MIEKRTKLPPSTSLMIPDATFQILFKEAKRRKMSVSRIYEFCSLVLPRSLGASPCRSAAASTAGSIISVAGRYYSSPESLSRARYSETTPTKISIVPADIFESFLLTLAPVVTEHYVL